MPDSHEQLQRWLSRVRDGRWTRRDLVQRLAMHGVSAPLAGLVLADAGLAQAASVPAYAPTRSGGGGSLRILMWQGPTLLNPHFSVGNKDNEAAALFYEPLAYWDGEGRLVPVLAAAIPSRDNGGVAADGRSVTWKLKQGVTWHDGTPFTADDVLFNQRYALDPATASARLGAFLGLKIEKLDSHTIRVLFDKPTPFWPGSYCATYLIPRHRFEPWIGARSRDAPNNLQPIGTGPYRFVDFRPGDRLRGERNPTYHQANRPHFDSVEVKGGGDATSAARAVLQTGEVDYAWDLLVEEQVLQRLERGGQGSAVVADGGTVEFIQVSVADPWTEVAGERSSPSSRHPILSDPAVRRALALLVDRQSLQDFVFGRAGRATPNVIANPARFRSPNNLSEFNVDKANAVLEAAGWVRGSDGLRHKNGRVLRFVYQTSINATRQKTQSIIKQACRQAGIELELKTVQGSVFFSSDVANLDTSSRFVADLQQFAFSMGRPDPARYMDQYVSWEIASKANKWQGRNILRWRNDSYDQLYRAAEVELDPARRAALFMRMNDLVVQDRHVLPLVFRPKIAGVHKQLVMALSGWSDDLNSIADWYRKP
jgi:peptide/nickel transport system substrate-binding protein